MRRWVYLFGVLGLLGMQAIAKGQDEVVVDTSVQAVASLISRVEHPETYSIKYSRPALQIVRWTLDSELRVYESSKKRQLGVIERVDRQILDLEKQAEEAARHVSVSTLSSLELLRQNCLVEQQRLHWESTASLEIASQEQKQRTTALEAKLDLLSQNLETRKLEMSLSVKELERAKQMFAKGVIGEAQVSEMEIKAANQQVALRALESDLKALQAEREGQFAKLALLSRAREVKSEKLAKELETLSESAIKVRGMERLEAEIRWHRRRLESLRDRLMAIEQLVEEKRNLLEVVDAALQASETKADGN